MARMWPRVIPAEVFSDPRRRSEIEVYLRLKGDLDDTWEVYYSRPWWGIGPKGGEIDGEADFIIAHAEAGILFVEVKGGSVCYLPERDQWTSRDSHGIEHKIKDPVKQAMVCKHRFWERLSSGPGWPRGMVRLRHGVILPDSGDPGVGNDSIGGNPRDLFCFAEQFSRSLKAWVESRLMEHPAVASKPEIAPGRAGVDMLRRLVADPVRLRVPFRRAVQNEVAELDRLTVQQLNALTLLESVPRALIEGGAGTGKTMLAMEMAARISDEGKRVCLLCYNAPLAAWLQTLLRDRPGINVSTFHAFCASVIRDAGLQVEPDTLRSADYYGTILPELAKRALSLTPSKRWDAVIVDEGQDFHFGWWSVIESALKEPGKGLLRVFLDSNQAVYGKNIACLQFDVPPFVMKHNLRNTREIVKITKPLLYTGPPVTPLGPQGVPPEMEEIRSMRESLLKAAQLAGNLVRDERISADDIAILLPAEEQVEMISGPLNDVGLKYKRAHEDHAGLLIVDTIRRFKGLEAAVVVMVVDRESAENRELGYVGVSRAKSRLFILGDFRDTLLERAVLQGREGSR